MSGVFGVIARGNMPDMHGTARRMGAAMRHLPQLYVHTAIVAPHIALGYVGVGILNPDDRPTSTPDSLIQLWLVGEFYHQQHRRSMLIHEQRLTVNASDSELALAVYLRDGLAGLTTLEGAFVLVLWDSRIGELVIVNDRYGLYPHYYGVDSQGLAFAPEIYPLVRERNLPPSETALAQYFRFQQLLGQQTWFDAIKLLPGGSVLRYNATTHTCAIQPYWDWRSIQPITTPISFAEAVAETTRLFQRAIDAMITPHRLGVHLSGGLDGRTIVGFVGNQAPLTTLTFGHPDCRDMRYAARIAQAAGTNHLAMPLLDGNWVREHAQLHLALTEGQHSWIHSHGITVLEADRSHMDIMLSGWAGGSVLGGYFDEYQHDSYYRNAASAESAYQHWYHGFCQRFTWPGLSDDEAEALLGDSYQHLNTLARDSLRTELAWFETYPAGVHADFFNLQQVDRRQFQNQIAITRAAVEVRCPFMDYRLVEYIFSLPVHIRATPQFRHAILTQRMPHLARIPNELNDRLPHTNRLLAGSYAFWKRAQGVVNRKIAPIFPDYPRLYADYEQYLRGDLRNWGEQILFSPAAQQRGWFKPAMVRALWERHQSGNELWTIGKLAPLITLEMVAQRYY
jgi:asparagine synthase (glutamine-hydrolysing)